MRRFKLGLPEAKWVEPGDPVTPEIRERLGTRKLLLWWHARTVGLKDMAIVSEKRVEESVANDTGSSQNVPEEVILALGGGWFQVTTADGSQTKVQGKRKARALLEG